MLHYRARTELYYLKDRARPRPIPGCEKCGQSEDEKTFSDEEAYFRVWYHFLPEVGAIATQYTLAETYVGEYPNVLNKEN